MTLPASSIEQKALRYLFSGRETLVLPSYQRAYSWGEKEVDELFEDILAGYTEAKAEDAVDDGYLLGNVIFLTFDRKDLVVLDGQQRLTTLFVIVEELARHVNPKYQGLLNSIANFLYNVDSYGHTDKVWKLKRESADGSLSTVEVGSKQKDYIVSKVQAELLGEGFDEKDGILDFILSVTFMVQKYFGLGDGPQEYKDKILADILKYFVKFNTRGKAFSPEEMEAAIASLEKR